MSFSVVHMYVMNVVNNSFIMYCTYGDMVKELLNQT